MNYLVAVPVVAMSENTCSFGAASDKLNAEHAASNPNPNPASVTINKSHEETKINKTLSVALSWSY